MQDLPKLVQEAKSKAIRAGVPFNNSYIPPYCIKSASTIGKTPFDFSFEKGEQPYDPYNADGWKDKMGTARQPVFAVFCLDNRFSGYFFDENKAKSLRDSLNIRHFNVAAMSENPKNPVLL